MHTSPNAQTIKFKRTFSNYVTMSHTKDFLAANNDTYGMVLALGALQPTPVFSLQLIAMFFYKDVFFFFFSLQAASYIP